MRRIALWAASTVSVLVLLFGYHTSTSGPDPVASPAVQVAPAVSGGGSGSAGSSGSSPDSTSSGSRTVTGDSVDTRWGPVQVEVTVDGGSITDVTVVEYPTENPRDQEINSYAIPTLVDETLAAQSADIDMVSGATVTSIGYQQSLQSALDEAGL